MENGARLRWRAVVDYGKICCALDLSEASGFVLEQAAALAARHGAVLVLVHVDPAAAPPAAEPAEVGEERAAADRTWLWARLDALRDLAEAHTGNIVYAALLTGDPAEEIVRYAGKHDADLVVLGTHGHSGVRRLVLGSVAEQVVRRAPCPVLVVREKVPVTEHREEEKLVEEYSGF